MMEAISERIFTQADYDRCAALTGDDNPIHVDPVFAASTRFGRTLAHGMLLYGVISGAIGELFPGQAWVQLWQELRFPGPTYTGEPMRIRVALVARQAEVAEIEARICRPDGSVACEGRSALRLLPQEGR